MSTIQIVAAILASSALAALIVGLLNRKKTAAETVSELATAKKTDAEATQLVVKTKFDLNSAELKEITGFTETVASLLKRATEQAKTIDEQNLKVSALLQELEASRRENESQRAVIKYQREESESLRRVIMTMGAEQNKLRAEFDNLSREHDRLKTEHGQMRVQLDQCLERHGAV